MMTASEKRRRLLYGNRPLPPVENADSGGTTVVAWYHEPETTATTDSSSSGGTTENEEQAQAKVWSRPNLSQVNLKIPKQLATRFDIWCFENQISKAEAFARALALLMDGGSGGSGGSGGTTGSTLRLDDSKTDDNVVVSLYRELTGNRWKDEDKQTLKELRAAGISTDRIECGIVKSVFKCPTRVGSLKYCRGAIEEIDESGMTETRKYVVNAKRKIAQKENLKREGKQR